MKVDIFDVGHGGCALITAPNGKRIMLDCGFNATRRWYPSVAFCGEWIDLLVAMNLDEDHLDDLPYLWSNVRIGGVYTNPTISAPALRAMKVDGMRDGVSKMHELLPCLTDGRLGTLPPDLGGAQAWCYYNRYPFFTDTNNLSLAVFVRYGQFTVLFAGDLEVAGWQSLLLTPGFAADLRTVNVLVASHHGRESGCCAEAFDHFRPQIVIFSDTDKQYGTQETANWYACRALGIPDFSVAPRSDGQRQQRKVLTTRRDGTINIGATETGFYNVETERTLLPSLAQNALSPRSGGMAPSGSFLAELLAGRH